MKSNQTRERILDESLLLFNEKKSSNVSTVQISTHMGISPGNLYYYFANKEELIRCIWKERMRQKAEKLHDEAARVSSARELVEFFQHCFHYYETYSFYYTELPTLTLNDPKLAEIQQGEDAESCRTLVHLFDNLAKDGCMKPLDEEEALMLATNCLTLCRLLLASHDVGSSIGQIVALLIPYFSDEMKRQIEDKLTELI